MAHPPHSLDGLPLPPLPSSPSPTHPHSFSLSFPPLLPLAPNGLLTYSPTLYINVLGVYYVFKNDHFVVRFKTSLKPGDKLRKGTVAIVNF